MGAYCIVGQTAAGSDKSILNLTGDGSIRIAWYLMIVSSDANPADAAGEFEISRTTTDGVTPTTTVTPEPLDPASVAATGTAFAGTYGTDPVDTSNSELLMWGLNQRATYTWTAFPGGELIAVITNNNGMHIRAVANSGTPNTNCCVHYRE